MSAVEVRFCSFESIYQRNNKSGGQKNLRCFPHCRKTGHVQTGFCGTPVVVTFQRSSSMGDQEYMCWGEICVASNSRSEMQVGSELTIGELQAQERTKNHPLKAMFKGRIIELRNGSVHIAFNYDLIGWHYGWTSVKYSSTLHTFRVYWCKVIENRNLIVEEVLDSPYFMVVSRRRQHEIEASKPTLPTKRKYISQEYSLREEYRRNRIIDRLFRFVLRFGNRLLYMAYELKPKAFYDSFNGTESYTLGAPDLPDSREFTEFLKKIEDSSTLDFSETIKDLGELCDEIIRISKNSPMCQKAFEKWTSPEGIIRFNTQCELEAARKPEWTLQHEDETFVDNPSVYLVERSIMAEFRQLQRDVTVQSLNFLGFSVERFEQVMEIASECRCIFMDPFCPPTQIEADSLALLVRRVKNANVAEMYGAGLDVFPSDKVRDTYAADILALRRISFQNLIQKRIDLKARINSLQSMRHTFAPLPTEIDFNGTWLDTKMKMENYNSRLSLVFDLECCDFILLLYKVMFSKIKIECNDRYFLCQGEPAFLGTGQLLYELNEKPHVVFPPIPLPLAVVGKTPVKSSGVAFPYSFFDTDQGRQRNLILIMIFQGVTLPGAYIAQRMPAFDMEGEENCRPFVLRAFEYMPGSRDHMYLTFNEFLVPGKQDVPLTREFTLRCFLDKEYKRRYEISRYTGEYMRIILNQEEEEQLVDLLS